MNAVAPDQLEFFYGNNPLGVSTSISGTHGGVFDLGRFVDRLCADFIIDAQKVGTWTEWRTRQRQEPTFYEAMQHNIVSERQVGDEWCYTLTESAKATIRSAQEAEKKKWKWF